MYTWFASALPGYGKKGMGWIKNPKKAAYNVSYLAGGFLFSVRTREKQFAPGRKTEGSIFLWKKGLFLDFQTVSTVREEWPCGNVIWLNTRNLRFLIITQFQKSIFKEITTMGFNYGIEKKKFNEEWKKLQKEYEEAGMSEKSIPAVRI